MSDADAWLAGPVGPILAIALMAASTYLLRVAGVLIMGRIPITPPVERALAALPGSIVAATVVPIAIRSGPAGIAGVVAAVVIAKLTGNELAALVLSLGVAALVRAAGF